jgi:hypothetical protein
MHAEAEEARLNALAAGPSDELRAVSEAQLAAREALRQQRNSRIEERIALFRMAPFFGNVMRMTIPITGGFNISAPPYDLTWTTGTASADENFGTFTASAGGTSTNLSQYSAAAVGFFLTSDAPVKSLVSVSPEAPVQYYWSNTPYSGSGSSSSTSSGGVGLLAYLNGNQTPSRVDRATLWSDSRAEANVSAWDPNAKYRSGLSPLGYPSIDWVEAYHEGSDFIAPALRWATGTPSFLLTISPGDMVLVWTFCWTSARIQTSGGLLTRTQSEIRATMPFVVIDSSPAPAIR